jgi:hypothetical protein
VTLTRQVHPEARAELLDAIRYYEGKKPGLGEQFEFEADRTVEDILWNPEAWPKFSGWNRLPLVRSHQVPVFPYRVVYLVRDDQLVIVAYAHQSRRPGYWQDRISDS